MKQGALIFYENPRPFELCFVLSVYYAGGYFGGGLGGVWRGDRGPGAVGYGENWYLVGVRAEDLNGLRVRI